MRPLSDVDLQVVAEDLALLEREWRPDVTDVEIRRATGALAILLLDGWYGRAWRACGKSGEPSVLATDFLGLLDRDISEIPYAQAGGGISQGIQVVGIQSSDTPLTSEELAASPAKAMAALEPRRYSLSAYLAEPSVIASGQPIPRRTVIQYVRNRLGGGGHLGLSDHRHREIFELLDRALTGQEVAGRPAIYFEALSIGQTVAGSQDARVLLNALSQKL